MAVVKEDTEGTPKAPSAATDFVPIRSGADLTQAFEKIENEELKASLGMAKPITGLESPGGTIPLYLKHSGVEGQAPNWGALLEASYGAVDTEGTEYDTVAASTVSVVKVDSGEGAEFRRGQALLVKKGTGVGYEIRPVESVSTDDLNLLFDLQDAPGSSVNLGKATTYYPADSGHPTLSLWQFLGNEGAIKLTAGNRVTNLTFGADAAQLLTAEATVEGLSNYWNPVEIAAADTYLDFTDDGGTFAAQIEAKMYKDPHQLAAAIQTAMNSVQTAETHACSYSDSTGKFSISTSTSTVLSLLWNTGGNAANTVGDKIGFSVAADDTGATSYAADSAMDWSNPIGSVSFDDADAMAAKDHEVLVGDADDTVCFKATSLSIAQGTPKRDINTICAESGRSASIINQREVTVNVSALMEKYDADKFKRMRNNEDVKFAYIFGEKSGGNWIPGKCGCVSIPTSTIETLETPDDDGLVAMNLVLKAYVNNAGAGESYISFV